MSYDLLIIFSLTVKKTKAGSRKLFPKTGYLGSSK